MERKMNANQFGELMLAIGRVETEQKNLRQELLGNGQPGRIQNLEKQVSSHEKKQWIHSTVIVPLNFVIHVIVAHFGFKG